MNKKNTDQISSYYKKSAVVKGYDTRRFAGVGGEYINTEEINSILDLALLLTGKKKILELGSGRGRLSFKLLENGLDLYCLEFSEEMIGFLSKQVNKTKILHQSVFDKIKTKNKFRVITSLRFFDHFNIFDQNRILKNVSENLENKGFIIMTLLNSNSLEAKLSKYFPYGRYNYYYDQNIYAELFQNNGLKANYKKSTFFIPRGAFLYLQKVPFITRPLILLDQALAKLFPNLCAMQTVVLEK